MSKRTDRYHVILFDGVCNLCNGFVSFVISNTDSNMIRFVSLQDEKAQKLLREHGLNNIDFTSIYFISENKLYDESSAILKISRYLNKPYRYLKYFGFVPKFIRDFVYKHISKNRYKIFGKSNTCRIPTPQERQYFNLD